MNKLVCLFSAVLMAVSAAQPVDAAEIAITVDDLPYAMPRRTSPHEGIAIVKAINKALAERNVIATGFVIGANINESTLPALEAFRDAGHSIGNHSWSHPDYNKMTSDQFRSETQKSDAKLADWMVGRKLYRFPYLRQGETIEKRKASAKILADLGYRNVPVSIDNDEWRFNADYVKALSEGDRTAAEQIATRYLEHMQERTAHFQKLAQDKFGRDVKHILLLHMNRINADNLGVLLDQYAEDGWSFITVEHALADPVYDAPDFYVGPRGLSQIERVTGGQ